MGFTKKPQPPEEEPGAPEWMLTFSDCMTLLLTFFVLLITFSAPGSGTISQTSGAFRKIMPGFGRSDERYRNALLNVRGVEPATYVAGGSATPTSETTGWGNLTQDFSGRDFSNRRVFLIPSKKIFWGKGTFVSLQGRDILQTMADLLKRLPNRVIISEGGDGGPKDGDRVGLQRAWVVLQHLAARQPLGRDRFSLSVTGTVHRENAQAGVQAENGADGPPPRLASGDAGAGQRMVEIVLLERSLYN